MHYDSIEAARPPINPRPRKSRDEQLGNLLRKLRALDAAVLRSEALAAGWAEAGALDWADACEVQARLFAGQAEQVRAQLKELEPCQ